MEMKIVVCGDSWMTPDIQWPGAHFSEILADTYNYQVTNLARGGISNTGICFQLELATKLQPDIIISNVTDSNRMAFSTGNYIPGNGLKNIRYSDGRSATCGSKYVGDANAPIIDDVMATIMSDSDWMTFPGNTKYHILSEQKEALRQYITYIHDEKLQETLDTWALKYWWNTAEQRGIKVLHWYEVWNRISITDAVASADAVFHTHFQAQYTIAEIYATLIDNIT
jgi:hypothetical protein